ncbi:MAG TPA: GDSL-type esterase/lipase family protein [Polyangia bacterium]|nr:GDSL-type esterase/lipase family protein [Polyangia bacterium]
MFRALALGAGLFAVGCNTGQGTGRTADAGGDVTTGGSAGSATGGAAATAGASGAGGTTATGGSAGGSAGGGHAGAGGNAGGASGHAGGGGGHGGAGGGGQAGGGAGGGAGRSPVDAGGPLPKLTIWIAGDSTVATSGGTPCPIGWGGQFQSHFNDRVTVVNSAVGGRSVRSWLYDVQDTKDSSGECVLAQDASGNPTLQAHWQAMLTGMKPGDYLFIQFGINDTDSTCPRHVGVTAFEDSYAYMAKAARDRGAQPVFVTPVSSISCTGSTAVPTRGTYAAATKQAGTQDGVPVIDLETASVALYNKQAFCPIPGGGDVSASTGGAVGAFFCDDHTHFSPTGAPQIASLVTAAIDTLNLPLAQYLVN